MNIIKLYMMQNILYFFVLLRQKYIMNQNRYAYNYLYHQCDKVFQPAHFRQLCAITFFGGLRKNFLKKISKNFLLWLFPAVPQADATPDDILGPPLDLLKHTSEIFPNDPQRAQYQAAKAQGHDHQRCIARHIHPPD